jgi:hypothetical protein
MEAQGWQFGQPKYVYRHIGLRMVMGTVDVRLYVVNDGDLETVHAQLLMMGEAIARANANLSGGD